MVDDGGHPTPDGNPPTTSLVAGLVGPARLPDAEHPVTDDLPPLIPSGAPAEPLLPAVSATEHGEQAPGAPVGGPRLTLHWRSLSDGLIFALVIGGPCLLAVEGLRHRVGKAWVVPLVIAGIGFLIAGAIAGRHRRRPGGALVQGVAVALPVAVLLDLTDLLYRVIGRRPINHHVLASLVGGLVGAIVLAVIGALVGRWLYLRGKRRRRSSPTH